MVRLREIGPETARHDLGNLWANTNQNYRYSAQKLIHRDLELEFQHLAGYGARMAKVVKLRGLILLLGIGALQNQLFGQGLSDLFADRPDFTDSSLLLTGSNTNFTIEPHEPLPAGKIGGHSGWIAWTAPNNGLVTLTTSGSSFDTLLAVYNLESGEDNPPLQSLQQVSANDDYGGQVTSYLQFGANSNQTYQIDLDGFNGATGDYVFQLNLTTTADLQPTVVNQPGDQALRIGDPLILTINLV